MSLMGSRFGGALPVGFVAVSVVCGAGGSGGVRAEDATRSVRVNVAAPTPVEAGPKVLELGGPPLARPSWLQPEGEEIARWRFVDDNGRRWAVDPVLGFTWLLAWDEHFTFVRTDRGALIESRADGVLGFVPPPQQFTVYDPAGFVIATRGDESLRAPRSR